VNTEHHEKHSPHFSNRVQPAEAGAKPQKPTTQTSTPQTCHEQNVLSPRSKADQSDSRHGYTHNKDRWCRDVHRTDLQWGSVSRAGLSCPYMQGQMVQRCAQVPARLQNKAELIDTSSDKTNDQETPATVVVQAPPGACNRAQALTARKQGMPSCAFTTQQGKTIISSSNRTNDQSNICHRCRSNTPW
jgi:hypothetical protein